MQIDVSTETVIDRPRAEVSAYAMDPRSAPTWYANIASVELHGTGALAVGSRMDFVASFLGRRLAYTYEVRALEPGARLVMATADGPFPMETTYAFTDAPGGRTLMSLRNRGRPSGFSRLVAPFMARAVRRANRKDLAALKAVLEGA